MIFQRLTAWLCGRSSKWPAVRKAYLAAHPRCAACGGDRDLEVHHIIPVSVDTREELNPGNLITLCRNEERLCHFRDGHNFCWTSHNLMVRADAANLLDRLACCVTQQPARLAESEE